MINSRMTSSFIHLLALNHKLSPALQLLSSLFLKRCKQCFNAHYISYKVKQIEWDKYPVLLTVRLVIGCSGQEVKCSVPTPWRHSNRWQDHIPHNPKCLEHMQSLKMSNIFKMSTCSCILSRKWNVCTSFCVLAPLNRLTSIFVNELFIFKHNFCSLVYWITSISSNILNLLLCQSDVCRYLSQSDYVYAGKEWEGASKSSRYPLVCSERSDEQSVRPSGWCKSHLRRQTAEGFKFDTFMNRFLQFCVLLNK